MLDIRVNGESTAIADGATVTDLLTQLDLPTAGLAVELNREIVPKRLHPETKLQSGDEVEVVTFVGGG